MSRASKRDGEQPPVVESADVDVAKSSVRKSLADVNKSKETARVSSHKMGTTIHS